MFKTRQLVMIIAAGATLASATALASCKSTDTASKRGENVIIGMANPFVDCISLECAADVAGFSIELPEQADLPAWVTKTIYRASTVDTRLIEIIYPGDDNFTKEIRIRKALTDKEDISGDYNSYEKEEDIIIAEKTVRARSNGDKIYLVTWHEGEYSYSARISEGATAAELEDLISLIK